MKRKLRIDRVLYVLMIAFVIVTLAIAVSAQAKKLPSTPSSTSLIPARPTPTPTPAPTATPDPTLRYQYTDDEFDLMRRIIFDEGSTIPDKGGTFWPGVSDEFILNGAVVLNRVMWTEHWPMNVRGVVFAKNQFSVAKDGKLTDVGKIITKGPQKDETAQNRYIKAVQADAAAYVVLNHWDELGIPESLMYFQRSKARTWGKNQRYYGRVGGHTFHYDKRLMTDEDWADHYKAMMED